MWHRDIFYIAKSKKFEKWQVQEDLWQLSWSRLLDPCVSILPVLQEEGCDTLKQQKDGLVLLKGYAIVIYEGKWGRGNGVWNGESLCL